VTGDAIGEENHVEPEDDDAHREYDVIADDQVDEPHCCQFVKWVLQDEGGIVTIVE